VFFSRDRLLAQQIGGETMRQVYQDYFDAVKRLEPYCRAVIASNEVVNSLVIAEQTNWLA